RPGVGALLAGIEQQQLTNIRVCNADAVEVLQQMIPDASLAAVYIFFPDPWHKKRHNKRRLIQPEFVKLLCQKLQHGGILHAATDWQEYAEHMLQVLQAEPALVNMSAQDYSEKPEYRPLTKFELRGKKLGHGVWDLIFKKV
ncbi:MAG: tRNA (guanosine(46)-N7)-methyltransferase TrmB, partial [Gammaproteobacteria bacterium]|nr:tRNA (guanosine(46)-N7)-methyltransferase TrmB [Gammaproteobacteria bacterium]